MDVWKNRQQCYEWARKRQKIFYFYRIFVSMVTLKVVFSSELFYVKQLENLIPISEEEESSVLPIEKSHTFFHPSNPIIIIFKVDFFFIIFLFLSSCLFLQHCNYSLHIFNGKIFVVSSPQPPSFRVRTKLKCYHNKTLHWVVVRWKL